MTDLFSKEIITLDDLREQLRRNDFTTMPVADKRKYSPDELEVHSYISGLIDEKWQGNAKTMQIFGCLLKRLRCFRGRIRGLMSDLRLMGILGWNKQKHTDCINCAVGAFY